MNKLWAIISAIWSSIPIILIAILIIFGLKAFSILHRNFDYTDAQTQNYRTMVYPDTVLIKEPALDLSLWERLWKAEMKPIDIQYVQYPRLREKNLISYVNADGKYITMNIRDCDELIGHVERIPYSPYFEIRTSEEGIKVYRRKDIFDWTKLWISVGYSDDVYGKLGTSIEYKPMRLTADIFLSYNLGGQACIEIRKILW